MHKSWCLINCADRCSGKKGFLCCWILCSSNTLDHKILFDRPEKWVGLGCTVHSQVRLHLKCRGYDASSGDHKSNRITMTCGVPQGSVVGLLLFCLSTSLLGHVTQQYYDCWLYFYKHTELKPWVFTPSLLSTSFSKQMYKGN